MRIQKIYRFIPHESVTKDVDYREINSMIEEERSKKVYIRLWKIFTCPHCKQAENIIFKIHTLFPTNIKYEVKLMGNIGKVYHEYDEDDLSIEEGSSFRVGFRRHINDFNFDVLSDVKLVFDYKRYVAPTTELFFYSGHRKYNSITVFGIDKDGGLYEYLLLFFIEFFANLYYRKRTYELMEKYQDEINDLHSKIRKKYDLIINE